MSTEEPPDPENMKLFSAKETKNLVIARLEVIDEKIDSIDTRIEEGLEKALTKLRDQRNKLLKEQLRKILTVLGSGGLIGGILNLLIILL